MRRFDSVVENKIFISDSTLARLRLNYVFQLGFSVFLCCEVFMRENLC